jgi:hypothetical protein
VRKGNCLFSVPSEPSVVVYFESKRPCYVGSRPGLCLEVFLNLAGNDALNRLGGHAEIFD